MADDQDYLDELVARRRATIGIKQTAVSDQSTTFNADELNREIERVTRAISGSSRTRYAVVNRGLDSLSDE